MAGAFNTDSTFVIAAVFGVLALFLFLFIINFVNHFIFHYKCPYIVRDAEVDGVYPTLILIYITIWYVPTMYRHLILLFSKITT